VDGRRDGVGQAWATRQVLSWWFCWWLGSVLEVWSGRLISRSLAKHLFSSSHRKTLLGLSRLRAPGKD